MVRHADDDVVVFDFFLIYYYFACRFLHAPDALEKHHRNVLHFEFAIFVKQNRYED